MPREVILRAELRTRRAEQQAARLDARLQRVGRGFGRAMRNASLAVAGLGAAMGAAALSAARIADELLKSSRNAGLTVGQFAELRFAFEQLGIGGGEAVQRLFQDMNRSITELSRGTATYVEAFEQIGLSFEDVADKSPVEVFETLVEAMRNTDDVARRTYAALTLLGRGGRRLGSLVVGGADELDRQRRILREIAPGIDNVSTAVESFNDAFNKIGTAIQLNFIDVFTQGINRLAGGVDNIEVASTRLAVTVGHVTRLLTSEAIDALVTVGRAVVRLADGFNTLARWLRPVLTLSLSFFALWRTAPAIFARLGFITQLRLAFRRLGRGIRATGETVREWGTTVEHFLQRAADRVVEVFTAFGRYFTGLFQPLRALGTAVSNVASRFLNFVRTVGLATVSIITFRSEAESFLSSLFSAISGTLAGFTAVGDAIGFALGGSIRVVVEALNTLVERVQLAYHQIRNILPGGDAEALERATKGVRGGGGQSRTGVLGAVPGRPGGQVHAGVRRGVQGRQRVLRGSRGGGEHLRRPHTPVAGGAGCGARGG